MILESIICILISIFAGLLTNKIFNINDIVKNNWSSFQCTTIGSLLYPFFGPKDISITDNEAQCNANKFNSMFQSNIQGTNNNINVLTESTQQLNTTINNIREKMSSIERNVFTDLNFIWQKIWGIYYKIIQLFIILYTVIQKLVNLFLQIIGIGAAAFYSFGSLYNGIVRKLMNSVFFCFHPNTPIKTIQGYIPIKNLKLNQKLSKNNYIKSIYIFNSNYTPLFKYKNIIVSGRHKVLEDGVWKYVEDSNYSKPYKSNTKLKYCLNTSQHIIKTINNTLFKDFEENYNTNSNSIYISKILSHLNKKEINVNLINYQPSGYSKNTLIMTTNGPIPIYKLKINQYIDNNNKIIGIMKSLCDDCYQYKNIIISGSTIIFENGLWIIASQSKFSKKIENKKIIIYHIQTSNTDFKTQYFKSKSIIPIKEYEILKSIENSF